MQPSTKKILLLRNLTDLNDESKIQKKNTQKYRKK
jgi:hypothetical protein